MSDIVINTKPNFRPLTGLAARKAAMASTDSLLKQEQAPLVLNPIQMKHRIGIVFDDSCSMSSRMIHDAHKGIEEFLRACEKDNTAVTIYPMNAAPLELSSNLPALALLVQKIYASGGTPLIQTLSKMLEKHDLTRAIVFSDGHPQSYSQDMYAKIIAMRKPIDTVYISTGSYVDETAVQFMRKLASDTDGIYLHFDSSKSNFATAFKYLSSGLRYLLADKSFRESL